MSEEKFPTIFGLMFVVVIYVLFSLIYCMLSAIPFWLLWNWLMPDIMGFGRLNLLQSLGLMMLFSLMFGFKPFNFQKN